MRYLIITVLMLVLFPSLGLSDITFTDGKWESTFNCSEWQQGEAFTCSPVQFGGNWYADGHGTSITSSANNPSGQGGRGARFWKASGADNLCSGTLNVTFPSPQKELWIRWSERYESGFSWVNGWIDVKSIYLKSGGGDNPYTGFYGSNGYRIVNQGCGVIPYPVGNSGGWNYIYPGGTSDGTWHSFEVHMKMDTNTQLGVGRLWIDGELVAEETGVNWSCGDSTTRNGWTYFDFLSNQKNPGLERAYYVDFDDLVVYNTTPPNTDDDGNSYIGPTNNGSSSLTSGSGTGGKF